MEATLKKPQHAKDCPACDGVCHTQHLLCAHCWSLVPNVEQRAVNDTWRRLKHAGGEGNRALLKKRRNEYEQARQAAIAHAVAANEATTAARPIDTATF